MDLALINLPYAIKPNQTKPNQIKPYDIKYLLALTFRVTRLHNSHQLLLTQCLLSAFRITPPPIWSFYSLFSSYANYRYSHIRSPQTHIPLFFFSPMVKHRRDVSNLFHYFLFHSFSSFFFLHLLEIKLYLFEITSKVNKRERHFPLWEKNKQTNN